MTVGIFAQRGWNTVPISAIITTSMNRSPTFAEEEILWQQGFRLIAGIDEVGRGPLAGPVVAAAVILPPYCDLPWVDQLRDSKTLSASRREYLASCVQEQAISTGIGMASHDRIDSINILQATKLAMQQAVNALTTSPDALLVDALEVPGIAIYQRSIIKGDGISRSIAAASIVAKVYRDNLMKEYAKEFPGYGFERNMGYGTKEHIMQLATIGCCPIHRTSFAPVRRALYNHV